MVFNEQISCVVCVVLLCVWNWGGGSLLYYCIAYVVQLYCEVSVAKCIVWYLSHSRIVLYVIISVKLYCVIISIQLYCEVADNLICLCVLYSFINIWCFCTVMLWVIVVQLFWMERTIVLNDVCCTVLECKCLFYNYTVWWRTIVLCDVLYNCTDCCQLYNNNCIMWCLSYTIYRLMTAVQLYCIVHVSIVHFILLLFVYQLYSETTQLTTRFTPTDWEF